VAIQKPKTILVVDDDAEILDVAAKSLRHLGHKILVAENGRHALEVVEQSGETIDLLVTDVIMPVMNGVELAENLAKISSTTRVIFMSGYLKPSLEDQNTPDYEKGFVQKPFSTKTLASRVKEVLKNN